MDIAETTVLNTCCSLINSLLKSLDCLSTPIEDLKDLKDGSVLVEIMESFDNAFGLYFDRKTNYSFIKQWLKRQGIDLGRNRTVDEILKSGERGHLTMLSYAITTVFLKNDKYLKKKFKSYKLNVSQSDLIAISLYTKWKLCEEEVEVKEMSILKQNNRLDIILNDNQSIQKQNNDLIDKLAKLNKTVTQLQNEAKKKEEEHKVMVARLIAELSHQKFKTMTTSIEYNL